MTVYGIQFRPSGQIYFFSSGGLELAVNDAVVVNTDQGESFGWVVQVLTNPPGYIFETQVEPGVPGLPENADTPEKTSFDNEESMVASTAFAETQDQYTAIAQNLNTDTESPKDEENSDPANQNIKPVTRKATQEDFARLEENKSIAAEARFVCRRHIKNLKLDMKLVDVDIFLDRSKYIFYFTAPNRIDFRELVKELVRQFRTRIELRQIGVRNETQMVGGIGNCGMPCCCRRYIRKFAPVTIKMAKEQNLFLNPAKISGTCGRLLCCLAYEQFNYEEFHGNCPKFGKKYTTIRGQMKVLRANFFRNSLSVLNENNEEQELTLEEWQALKPIRHESLQNPSRQHACEQSVPGTTQEREAKSTRHTPDVTQPETPKDALKLALQRERTVTNTTSDKADACTVPNENMKPSGAHNSTLRDTPVSETWHDSHSETGASLHSPNAPVRFKRKHRLQNGALPRNNRSGQPFPKDKERT